MTTPSREKLAKKLLDQQETAAKMKHRPTRPHRTHRLQQLPSPTEQQLQLREAGWNDRFSCDKPTNATTKPSRPERAVVVAANSPKAPTVAQHRKERKIRDERLQYGACDREDVVAVGHWNAECALRSLLSSSLRVSYDLT